MSGNYFLFTAVERAGAICRQADIITALTLDVLKGTTRAFDSSECFLIVKQSVHQWHERILMT